MEEYNKNYGANNHTSLLSHAQSQSPRKLLHDAKSFQESHAFKYCWSKDSTILLRKTDNSRIYKLRNLEDLEELLLSLNRPIEEE